MYIVKISNKEQALKITKLLSSNPVYKSNAKGTCGGVVSHFTHSTNEVKMYVHPIQGYGYKTGWDKMTAKTYKGVEIYEFDAGYTAVELYLSKHANFVSTSNGANKHVEMLEKSVKNIESELSNIKMVIKSLKNG